MFPLQSRYILLDKPGLTLPSQYFVDKFHNKVLVLELLVLELLVEELLLHQHNHQVHISNL
jgi:hypothetical protein